MLKSLITPTEPVPASRLGRVHFTGSDAMPSALVDDLRAHGARVHIGHASANLGDLGAGDTLVLSSAIRPDNPELVEATRRDMRIMHRAAALASVMAGRRIIAVAGTHGKTTTTSMLTTVLREAGADPGYVIGGILNETGLGAEDGAGPDFVAEADESDGSFLLLSPDMAIITNVEADHLDNYGSLAEIEEAFAAFGGRVSGPVLTCADDPGAEAVAARLDPHRVRRYGESGDAAYRLGDVRAQGLAVSFTVSADHSPFGAIVAPMTVHVPGRHNALNATAAFAAAVELGVAPTRAAPALAGYRGARRRMELKGEADGVRVFDSYAHHPTELAADLRAARDIVTAGSGEASRVIAIFQPHLYSRTRIFAADFGAALGLADEAIVLDVYAAREDPEPGVTGELVADAVPGGRARFLLDRTQAAPMIARIAEPGDVVLTMGAGDVTALGPQLVEALRGRHG
jgi:UDP-N-acetylmuramate--alanine ligase